MLKPFLLLGLVSASAELEDEVTLLQLSNIRSKSEAPVEKAIQAVAKAQSPVEASLIVNEEDDETPRQIALMSDSQGANGSTAVMGRCDPYLCGPNQHGKICSSWQKPCCSAHGWCGGTEAYCGGDWNRAPGAHIYTPGAHDYKEGLSYPFCAPRVNVPPNLDGNVWPPGSIGRWVRVRHVPAGTTWHPVTDHLAGNIEYGDKNDDSKAWSINFHNEKAGTAIKKDFPFEEFLFASGDGQFWLRTSKGQATNFQNQVGRRISSSSENDGYELNVMWYNRASHDEDPWISLADHNAAAAVGKGMLYGANSKAVHNYILTDHGGADVYIRSSYW